MHPQHSNPLFTVPPQTALSLPRAPLAEEENFEIEPMTTGSATPKKAGPYAQATAEYSRLTNPEGNLLRQPLQQLLSRMGDYFQTEALRAAHTEIDHQECLTKAYAELSALGKQLESGSRNALSLEESTQLVQKLERLSWLIKDGPPGELLQRLAKQCFTSWLLAARQDKEAELTQALQCFMDAELQKSQHMQLKGSLGYGIPGLEAGSTSLQGGHKAIVKSGAGGTIETQATYSAEIEQRLGLKAQCIDLFTSLCGKYETSTTKRYANLNEYATALSLGTETFQPVTGYDNAEHPERALRHFQRCLQEGFCNEQPFKEIVARQLGLQLDFNNPEPEQPTPATSNAKQISLANKWEATLKIPHFKDFASAKASLEYGYAFTQDNRSEPLWTLASGTHKMLDTDAQQPALQALSARAQAAGVMPSTKGTLSIETQELLSALTQLENEFDHYCVLVQQETTDKASDESRTIKRHLKNDWAATSSEASLWQRYGRIALFSDMARAHALIAKALSEQGPLPNTVQQQLQRVADKLHHPRIPIDPLALQQAQQLPLSLNSQNRLLKFEVEINETLTSLFSGKVTIESKVLNGKGPLQDGTYLELTLEGKGELTTDLLKKILNEAQPEGQTAALSPATLNDLSLQLGANKSHQWVLSFFKPKAFNATSAPLQLVKSANKGQQQQSISLGGKLPLGTSGLTLGVTGKVEKESTQTASETYASQTLYGLLNESMAFIKHGNTDAFEGFLNAQREPLTAIMKAIGKPGSALHQETQQLIQELKQNSSANGSHLPLENFITAMHRYRTTGDLQQGLNAYKAFVRNCCQWQANFEQQKIASTD